MLTSPKAALAFAAVLILFVWPQTGSGKPREPRNRPVVLGTCGQPKGRHQFFLIEHFGFYWLEQDVREIITDPERKAYVSLFQTANTTSV